MMLVQGDGLTRTGTTDDEQVGVALGVPGAALCPLRSRPSMILNSGVGLVTLPSCRRTLAQRLFNARQRQYRGISFRRLKVSVSFGKSQLQRKAPDRSESTANYGIGPSRTGAY